MFVVGSPERPECQECGLWKKCLNPFIPPVMEREGEPVDLACVGEAPGKNEDAEKEYFVGKAGALLDKIIEGSVFKASNVAFFNCCQCWPGPGPEGKGDAKPTTEQMRACRPLLLKNLEMVNPKAVVALGQWGARALLDDGTATIGGKRPTRVRRLEIKDSTWQPRVCTATYHPAATYQYQPHIPRCIDEDLTWVMQQLIGGGLTIPEYRTIGPEELVPLAGAVPTAIDLEYDGDEGGTDLYSVALRTPEGNYAALLNHPENLKYDAVAWREAFQAWIDQCPWIIGHNLPSDLLALARFGVRLPEVKKITDTLAASRVKWHNDPDRSLETLAAVKLGLPDYAGAITSYKKKHKGKFGYHAPGKILLDYNFGDVWATTLLMKHTVPNLPPFLWAHMMEAEYNLVLSTWDGQYVNGQAAIDLFLTLDKRVLRWLLYLERLTEVPGYNYRSEAHKSWPFENLGWTPIKEGPEGPSLDEEILSIKKREGRKKSKRFARALLKLKKAENAQNRLRKDILGRMDEDRLIHAQFNTAGARTLRLSSKQPNFQNLSKELRRPFVSRWKEEK